MEVPVLTSTYGGRNPFVSLNPPVKLKIPELRVRSPFAKAPVAPVTVKTAPAVAVAPKMVTPPPPPPPPEGPVGPVGPPGANVAQYAKSSGGGVVL